MSASRSGYQPLQSHEDDEDDVGHDTRPTTNAAGSSAGATGSSHHRPRAARPGSIDLTKLDNAFKRYIHLRTGLEASASDVLLDGQSLLLRK